MDQMSVSISDRVAGYVRKKVKSGLTQDELEGIRRRVRASIESIERGEYVEYQGRDGLKKLADGVKAADSLSGKRLLPQTRPAQIRFQQSLAAQANVETCRGQETTIRPQVTSPEMGAGHVQRAGYKGAEHRA